MGSTLVRTFIGVSEKKARESGVNGLGLAGWNNFSGLWAMRVVSSCLVPDPGLSKAEYLSLGCTSQAEDTRPCPGSLADQKHAQSRVLCLVQELASSTRGRLPQPEKLFEDVKTPFLNLIYFFNLILFYF